MSSTSYDNYVRGRYLKQISPFLGKPLIKIITGQRRVGKSYLLKQLIDTIIEKEPQANIIAINKEEYCYAHIKNDADLHAEIEGRLIEGRKNYIFIDEVQEIENFHLPLRSFALDASNDIIITGSNSSMFASDLANMLGGRTITFRVYSLCYLEFLQFHQLDNTDNSLALYEQFGGLPGLIHYGLHEESSREYLKALYDSIVLRDIIARKKIRNTAFLEQLILFLADNIGQLFSAKRISDFLKSQRVALAASQVADYTQALRDAFIIERVRRYDIKGKQLFEYGEKYYFENLGLRNALIGYRPQDQAQRLENLVYNHLRYCQYELHVGTIGKEEIDFVCSRNSERLYVQVTLELTQESTIEREFGNLLKIKDQYPKMVVTASKSHQTSYEGVRQINIRDFLSQLW